MPRLIALLIAVFIVLLGIMTCLPLLREKAVQKRVTLELEEELKAEQTRTRELEAQIARVRNDPAFVEKLAREKFGLGKTGEVIFKFRSDLPVPSGSPKGPARVPGP